ncbi:hypothetical protein JB92DRAFT_3043637, partial [Gautieria morchelliformis]
MPSFLLTCPVYAALSQVLDLNQVITPTFHFQIYKRSVQVMGPMNMLTAILQRIYNWNYIASRFPAHHVIVVLSMSQRQRTKN